MQVLALVGSYRKGGVTDSAVDVILETARSEGAETEKVYLIDEKIEFCTNCRLCTQLPGEKRGECPISDGMVRLLERIERCDALVLGSPMNFGTVTAITKRFIERLVCFAYWPWGAPAPKIRSKSKNKRAVLIASSAAPSPLARLTSRQLKLQKDAAALLGASTVGTLFVGLAASEPHREIGARVRRKASRLGARLVKA